MKNPNSAKLAVLIDADNASYAIISELLAEVSRYGIATVKRAYGDWTTQNLKGWKEVLHKLAIQPIQQFGYTTGKNATDSALIIEAMDLLHTGHLDGFCIVSSEPLWRRATSLFTPKFCGRRQRLPQEMHLLQRQARRSWRAPRSRIKPN
jgi:hypothetical protein